MGERGTAGTGQALVETTFSLGRRGQVVVLRAALEGVVPKCGQVETSIGVLPYKGPEFVDDLKQRRGWLAVIVPVGHGAERLTVGEPVTFFERA